MATPLLREMDLDDRVMLAAEGNLRLGCRLDDDFKRMSFQVGKQTMRCVRLLRIAWSADNRRSEEVQVMRYLIFLGLARLGEWGEVKPEDGEWPEITCGYRWVRDKPARDAAQHWLKRVEAEGSLSNGEIGSRCQIRQLRVGGLTDTVTLEIMLAARRARLPEPSKNEIYRRLVAEGIARLAEDGYVMAPLDRDGVTR